MRKYKILAICLCALAATGLAVGCAEPDAGDVSNEDAGFPWLDGGGAADSSAAWPDASNVGVQDAATAAVPEAGVDSGRDAALEPSDAGAHDSSSPGGDAATTDAGSGGACADSYASFGQQFMTTYCVSCHGGLFAQKSVHLDTLPGVTSAKAKVKSEVTKGSMPPRGSKAPSSEERTRLAAWIDCGPL